MSDEPLGHFLDTSALAKYYHREKGTDLVELPVDQQETTIRPARNDRAMPPVAGNRHADADSWRIEAVAHRNPAAPIILKTSTPSGTIPTVF